MRKLWLDEYFLVELEEFFEIVRESIALPDREIFHLTRMSSK